MALASMHALTFENFVVAYNNFFPKVPSNITSLNQEQHSQLHVVFRNYYYWVIEKFIDDDEDKEKAQNPLMNFYVKFQACKSRMQNICLL